MKKRMLALVLATLVSSSIIPAAVSAAVDTKAEIVSGVSFRDRPTTSSNVKRYLKTGETVTVLQMMDPYWYKVQDSQGVTGYVSSSSKYISVVSNTEVIAGVNFRTGPSTTASKIRLLSTGEDVLLLEKINDSWYKAKDSKDTVGYVSSGSKYIDSDFSVYKPVLPLEDRIEAFISEGMKYMGTPYEFGSDRFDLVTFDCSDFIQQAFWDATRVVIPGDSRAQGDYAKDLGQTSTDWRSLKRGDLLFFSSYYGSRASDYQNIDKSTETITHVGIYLGDGTVLHTYSPESGGVRIDSIAGKAWEYRFLYGGSITK